MSVKGAALAAITQDAFVPFLLPLVSDLVVVMMLHRFEDRELNIAGDSAKQLQLSLEFLRHHRFHLASLQELLSGEDTRSRAVPTVVFTVDDGYADFAKIAAPIFAAFDCPVTVFVVTDAIDRKTWYWWDRVEYTVENSKRDTVRLELSTGHIEGRRTAPGIVSEIAEALKRVPDDEKEAALVAFAQQMDVDVPELPTPKYAAMTWDDVRSCAARGVTFGPHTVRHPMLTRVDPAIAASEMLDSWTRLQAECSNTVPVFCYPNGAFEPHHVDVLARSDIKAGVSTDPRYASREAFVSRDPKVRYAIPRFAYPGSRDRFVQIVTGVERVKMGVREGLRGWQAAGDK